jgi:hypothetical protein
MLNAMREAACIKDEPADIINVAFEELVRQRFELPVFHTLNRVAQHARSSVARAFDKQIYHALDETTRARLDALFQVELARHFSPWNALRQDTRNPTLTHLKELIVRHDTGGLADDSPVGSGIGRPGRDVHQADDEHSPERQRRAGRVSVQIPRCRLRVHQSIQGQIVPRRVTQTAAVLGFRHGGVGLRGGGIARQADCLGVQLSVDHHS